MKLDNEQISSIRQELNGVVKYQETFNEVFDHLMLVIAGMPDNGTVYPETLTNEVIELEFGGYDNLRAMEKASTKLAFKAMKKKHWQNITYFFNWPVIVFTIAMVIVGYYFCLDAVNRKHLVGFTLICALLPIISLMCAKLYIKYKSWYHHEYRKASIKDGYIINAAVLSNSIINVLLYVIDKSVILTGPISLLVFVLFSIYVLSFFKLYHQEYRLNVT